MPTNDEAPRQVTDQSDRCCYCHTGVSLKEVLYIFPAAAAVAHLSCYDAIQLLADAILRGNPLLPRIGGVA